MVETEETLNIGEQLRNARLKQGKTLGDVSKDLCIRKIYLEAIEKLDYQNLAPVPYGVGFVRSYAEYLGMDVESTVKAYKLAAKTEDTEKKNIPEEAEEDEEEENGVPNIRHMLIGLAGLVVIFTMWQCVPMLNSESAEKDFNEAGTESVILEPVIIEDAETEAPALTEMGVEDMSESNAEENNGEAEVKDENSAKVEAKDKSKAEKVEQSEKTEKKNIQKNAKEEQKAQINTESSEAMDSPTPTAIRMVLAGPSWIEVRKGREVLVSGTKSKGFTYDIPNEKGIIVSVGRYYNVDFYVRGRLTKIASSLRQTNIKLDKYIEE